MNRRPECYPNFTTKRIAETKAMQFKKIHSINTIRIQKTEAKRSCEKKTEAKRL